MVRSDLAHTRHTALTASGLTRGDTGALVRALLAGKDRNASALDRLEEQVWRVSDGNPFLVCYRRQAGRPRLSPTQQSKRSSVFPAGHDACCPLALFESR